MNRLRTAKWKYELYKWNLELIKHWKVNKSSNDSFIFLPLRGIRGRRARCRGLGRTQRRRPPGWCRSRRGLGSPPRSDRPSQRRFQVRRCNSSLINTRSVSTLWTRLGWIVWMSCVFCVEQSNPTVFTRCWQTLYVIWLSIYICSWAILSGAITLLTSVLCLILKGRQ